MTDPRRRPENQASTRRVRPWSLWLAAPLLAALAGLGCQGVDERPEVTLEAVRQAELRRHVHDATLLYGLESRDPAVRKASIRAMGRIQDEFHSRYLGRVVESLEGDLGLRREALFALGQSGLRPGGENLGEAVAAVLGELERSSAAGAEIDLRVEALVALGKLAPAEAMEVLAPHLSAAEPAVREAAAMAVFRSRSVQVWRGQAAEPPPLLPELRLALIELLEDPEPAVRRAAAYGFSRWGEDAARPTLAARWSDPDSLVRLYAVRALARSGASGDALLLWLDDGDRAVRLEALLGLEAAAAGDSVPLESADDPWFAIRAAAAKAWGSGTSPASARALAILADDPSDTVRAAALEARTRRTPARAVGWLTTASRSPSWIVRRAVVRAADHLEPRAAWPWIAGAWEDSDVRVRTAAVEAAGELAASTAVGGRLPAAEDLLLRALEEEDLAIRGTAVTVLDPEHPRHLELLETAYLASLGPEWIEVREAIARSLGRRPELCTFLESIATQDPAVSVRAIAKQRIGQLWQLHPRAGEDLVGASEALPTPSGQGGADAPVVRLDTDRGTFRIRTQPEGAPRHVAAFLSRVRSGFYDGLIWHRVVPNFVVQGGDPRGDGWGSGGPPLPDEIHPGTYAAGTVGMPKAGKDTGGCQLFVSLVPTPRLDGFYTVFGQVVEGLNVLGELQVGDRILEARVEGEGEGEGE